MTKERSEEVLLIAVALSVALHILLMAYAKPKVMTHVASGVERVQRRAPMRVTGELPRPQPVKIDALEDVEAGKSAPEAEQEVSAAAPSLEAAGSGPAVPEAPAAAAEIAGNVKPGDEQAYRFSEEALRLDDRGAAEVRVSEVETPVSAPAEGFFPPSGPQRIVASPLPPSPSSPVAPPPALDAGGPVAELPREKADEDVRGESFTPASKVFEKVDERIVEREKAAVRELVDASDAAELEKFVNVVLSASTEAGWTYFKVMFSPRGDLPVVPKDLVVLIDASGSIGKDRISSIRSAAKRILRSATNSGDRFNFVAFRDRFSYAFQSWQECTEESFARADRWISNVAVHGRTDVFATIRSVLTLPRTPERPIVALVVTDGVANTGVKSNAEIISKFTALNDGLVSVYMYGVKSTANRDLIDILTRGNRGESYIFEGMRWRAGAEVEGLSERFRDPVLSDLRVVFSADTPAEAYPARLKNLYRGETLELVGRVREGTRDIAFSVKGLNGSRAYEGFFRLPLATAAVDGKVVGRWCEERRIDLRLR